MRLITNAVRRRCNIAIRHLMVNDGMADALDNLWASVNNGIAQEQTGPRAADIEAEVTELHAQLMREIGA